MPRVFRKVLDIPLARGAATAFVVAALTRSTRAQAPLVPVPAPLTFEAALDLATSRNLGLEAARRQRAIREAAIRIARQIPNPDVSVEVTRDTPHAVSSFNLPVEI